MKIANGTLVLVADGAKMLLLRNDGDAKYPVLKTLDHEEAANLASRVHGSDRPGRAFASSGDRRSTYGETDWHQQAEDAFARDVADVLNKVAAREEGGFVVIAPPKTLSTLRAHYGKVVETRLLGEISKDLAQHMTDDIADAIAAHTP